MPARCSAPVAVAWILEGQPGIEVIHGIAKGRKMARSGLKNLAVAGTVALLTACGSPASPASSGGGGTQAQPPSATGGGGTPTGGANSEAQGGRADGGAPGTGGQARTGGAPGTGGQAETGGAPGTGGSPGSGGVGVADGGRAATCKRGIASNTAPGDAFSRGVTWWYNWSAQPSGAATGIEFVPMLWGSGSLNASVPSAAKILLAFNEPNFKAQSNLTAAAAAALWPQVEGKAAGRPIVGPGMNYCGPADQCNGTDPYQYLRDFFAACTGCQIDYVAVHWYNCDLPSLRDYLEPGGNLPGFEQFDRPIWITEFSCDGTASVADQEAYMRAAIPYLEGNPKVARYAWFSAGPIPNAQLMNSDGTPNALGQVYLSLAQSCP
jgi:hypothetical protein